MVEELTNRKSKKMENVCVHFMHHNLNMRFDVNRTLTDAVTLSLSLLYCCFGSAAIDLCRFIIFSHFFLLLLLHNHQQHHIHMKPKSSHMYICAAAATS